jgi:hypothetical protein
MFKRRSRCLQPLLIFAFMLSVLSPGFADEQIVRSGRPSKKLCYCACDQRAEAAACAHLCELPKYENRSWATSCHKKEESVITKTPDTRSKKRNGIEHAHSTGERKPISM